MNTIEAKNIHDIRLLTLADRITDRVHCEHTIFSFRDFHKPLDCGTAGCALGECPNLFPEDWEWWGNNWKGPVLRGHTIPYKSAVAFFNLSDEEVEFLFYPDRDRPDHLPGNASAEMVAERLREFVKDRNPELYLIYEHNRSKKYP